MQQFNYILYLTALVGLPMLTVVSANDEGHQVSVNATVETSSSSDQVQNEEEIRLQSKLEYNRHLWLQRNGERTSEEEEILYRLHPGAAEHSQNETDKSISVLKNLVHPEEELQDEINDRQIIQAVVASMAEWNLRKLQKLRKNKNKTASVMSRNKRNEATVCYNEVGCFRDEGPFNYLDLLPAPPEEINTRFFLYTPRNRDVAFPLAYNNVSTILFSPYNNSLPTKVMIHGFGSSCQRVWAKEMRTALIRVGDVNVICVDWENGASLPNYVRAAVNARLVGRQVALLVNAINSITGSKNADFHLIGFSLGAHVAGFAGSELHNLSRITGLDPAGPLFENYDPRARLDSTDADLVDVIHSNGEKIYMGGLGAWAPMGDLDFYPNGGRMQKGCSNLFVGAVSDMIWSSAEENGRSLCNHRRAYKLFTDSVVPGCHFPAFACESYEKLLEGDCFPCADAKQCSSMGYYADKSAGRGIMYLATREEEPFCANQYRVVIQSTITPQPVSTQGKIELVLIGVNNFNETFTLTKGPDFELISGGKLVRLIVPHPSFSPPTKINVVYTAYHGWIYNGLPKWPIDKIVLTDSFGKSVSYCQRGMYLDSGKGLSITLHKGECNLPTTFLKSGPLDNEIPILLDPNQLGNNRLRSLENNGTVAGPNLLDGLVESRSARSNNTVNNIYPYGNVPLSMLQQIPADIKVGSGNTNNNNNKRPSFYQWPLVGASQAANFLFGTNGRARFKSLGGGGGSRKYEPQGQLTPPSLQQLQQASSKENPPERPRRPYFRRGSNQPQQMTPEEQNKAEYYLLRQQQLHLQQQQLLQANRMMWGTQPVRGQSPAFSFQQQTQSSPALTPNQWVLTPPQPQASPPQWRPDAVVIETETSRYPSALLPLSSNPDIQSSLATDQAVQQQQIAIQQVVRNQPSFGTPIRSSIQPHSDVLAPSSVPVVVNTLATPPVQPPLAPSGVTLETMTVSNTLSNTPLIRVPTIENQGVPYTILGDSIQIEADGADLLQSASFQQSLSTEDPILSLVPAAQTTNLLLVRSSSSNRQTTNDPQLLVNVTGESTVDDITNTTATFNQSTTNASSISTTKDVFIRDNPIAATIWSDYAFVSDSSNNGADELYPNPSQLGQARDEYWSNKASASKNYRGRQMSFPTIPESPPPVGVAAVPYYTQYAASAVRPPRLLVNQAQHQPLYIPISPFQVDRQNRKLQPQYYADSSSYNNNNNKLVAPTEPVAFAAAGNQRAGISLTQ